MKSVYFLLFLCSIIIQKHVEAGALGDLFGSIHNAADKVRDDIRNTLHINREPQPAVETEKIDNNKEIELSTVKAVTTEKAAEQGKQDDSKATTEVINTPTTKTPDGGRENFAADACLDGFTRSEDGCKKQFG